MTEKNQVFRNPFLLYILKFLATFCVLYYSTYALIGLASPASYYSPFVDHYLDYVSGIKNSLIWGASLFLKMLGIATQPLNNFALRIVGGKGVVVAQSCVGIGVYSFWIAFVVANRGSMRKKIMWIIFGLLGLWLINVIRIALFLLAVNKGWPMPLGLDHHTWFNIFAYLLIFILIWFYDRRGKINRAKKCYT